MVYFPLVALLAVIAALGYLVGRWNRNRGEMGLMLTGIADRRRLDHALKIQIALMNRRRARISRECRISQPRHHPRMRDDRHSPARVCRNGAEGNAGNQRRAGAVKNC